MDKGMRLSERWFRRGLWLVALVFAGFLVGLGNAVVPQVAEYVGREILARAAGGEP